MLRDYAQEDGRLLGIGCADQVAHRTEPWEMAITNHSNANEKWKG